MIISENYQRPIQKNSFQDVILSYTRLILINLKFRNKAFIIFRPENTSITASKASYERKVDFPRVKIFLWAPERRVNKKYLPGFSSKNNGNLSNPSS